MPSSTSSSSAATSDSGASASGCVIGEEWRDRVVVIAVVGDIDIFTVSHLETAVDTALQKRPSAMIIDLTGVDFLASRGMSVLIQAREAAPAQTHVFAVADAPATARPLRLTGIDRLVPVFGTLDQALAAIG